MVAFKKFSLSFVLLFAFLIMQAQSINQVDTIAGNLIKAIQMDKSESIQVQTNKWYYAAGEDLWFKAWVTNKVSGKFYSHSQNLYVDIVDERDTAIAKLLLNIPSEHTEGYIRISDSIPEGNYWLRAFTSSMLNSNLEDIFVKPIYIVNTKYTSKLNFTKPIKNVEIEDPIVSIFPEGASVITGITQVFGIKSSTKTGKPVAVKGYITDNSDSTAITWFSTDSLTGLGKFSFHVTPNKIYTAHIQIGKNIIYQTLPKSLHYGSQIAIKQTSPLSLKVVVSQGDSLYKKGVTSYLLGISKDSLCFVGVGVDMFELNVPKMAFPTGEAKLLLINQQGNILSERSFFVTKNIEQVKIVADKDKYGSREKVSMDIFVGDSVFHPMFSALSIAITDDKIVKDPVYEEGPLVNVSDTNPVLNDLIMLTKSPIYAGKNVKEINRSAKSNDQKVKNESDFELIEGTVLNRKKIPAPNRIVTLYSNKKINLFDTDTTNKDGKFKFKIPLHYDSIPFTLQVSNLKGNVVDEKIVVDLVSKFPVVATPIRLKQKLTPQQSEIVSNFRTFKSDTTYLTRGKEWLKDVVVKSSIKSNSYNTTKRVSNFSQVMTGEAIQKMTNTDAANAMLMIPGLHLRGGFISLGGMTSFTISAKDEPLLIVDGVMVAGGNDPATDTENVLHINSSPVLEELTKIPVDIIDFVEVLKGPEAAYYGTRSSNGVIIVNTHRVSNFRNHIENYGTIQYNSKSYHLAPNFNTPDYNDLFIKSNVVKDTRSTLYWNGHLYTNLNGKASFSFYTSDNPNNYTINITGVTVTGEQISKKFSFNNF
jgi:TonB-dependent Receptor Plug Domain